MALLTQTHKMKVHHFFIGLVAMLVFLTTAQAQRSIHLSGGVDFSTVSLQGPQVWDPANYTGYHAGVTVQQRLADKWSINLASQIVLRGHSGKNIPDVAHKRTYIDVQPEVGYRVLANTEIGIGGYYGILLAEYSSSSTGIWQNLQDFGAEDKDDIGLTLSVTQSFGPVVLYARYKHGLQKLNELTFTDEVGNEVATQTQQNRQVQLGIGYRFGL